MTNEKEKAIDRAKKLMAMAADSPSPNEAAIAAKRARAIIDKHQLSDADLLERSDFGSYSAGKARQRIPQWESNIVIGVANLNDCIARFDRSSSGNNKDKIFAFKGFKEDCEIARFMYHYITQNCIRCCTEYINQNPNGCRNSFKMGYSFTISRRIDEIIKERRQHQSESTGKSLVLIKKQLVEQEFGEAKYTMRSSSRSLDYNSTKKGREAARKTNITTGIREDHREPLPAA